MIFEDNIRIIKNFTKNAGKPVMLYKIKHCGQRAMVVRPLAVCWVGAKISTSLIWMKMRISGLTVCVQQSSAWGSGSFELLGSLEQKIEKVGC